MADEEAVEEPRAPISATDYVAPQAFRAAFHCPHCQVYAQHRWARLSGPGPFGVAPSEIARSICDNCGGRTYWLTAAVGRGAEVETDDALMVAPGGSTSAPNPHPDFPADPRVDYEEARSIVDRSPRGAVALLRLAVQKLCGELGEPGKNINDDIGSLVKQGLPPGVQVALDSLRVIGNNAVHPGQVDLKDDTDTAVALFGVLNFIVEQMITRPKELQKIQGLLPLSALAAIQKRDSNP